MGRRPRAQVGVALLTKGGIPPHTTDRPALPQARAGARFYPSVDGPSRKGFAARNGNEAEDQEHISVHGKPLPIASEGLSPASHDRGTRPRF